MGLTKSLPQNLRRSDGNGLTLFIFDQTNELYLTDIYGNIQPLSDYINIPTQSSVDNLGTGAQVYKTGSSNPFDFRSLKQGSNVTITQNADEIEIAVPTISGVPLYYGSFYSTQKQTTIGNEQKAMTFNNTDVSSTFGVSIVSNSRITVANAGVYNIAFSAQILKKSGGGATQIYIWAKKNGNNLPDTNTVLTLANNGDLLVAAWNLFINLNANEYVELFWYATAASLELHYNATPIVGLPEIPSVIATINRVG